MSIFDTAEELGYFFRSPSSRKLLQHIARIAPSGASVLIRGDTGTGKEVVAELLHRHSRRKGPLVPVHCGAIPTELFESVLFGHVRGAFSGAVRGQSGRVELAENGTLFLDEIGELVPYHQQKLLRLLDGYGYQAVGSNKTVMPDVRVLAATNRDLRVLRQQGHFRTDLYARLSVFELSVPSLDQRPEDVIALVERRASQLQADNAAFVHAVVAAARRLSGYRNAWPLGMRRVMAFVEHAFYIGIEQAEERMHREWMEEVGPVIEHPPLESPRTGLRDREQLTQLICSVWEQSGIPSSEKSKTLSQALAVALLNKPIASIDDIGAALERQDHRTIKSYLQPLWTAGLVRLNMGTIKKPKEVSAVWPPLVVTLSQTQAGAWVPVAPGTVPLVESGARLRIDISSMLDVTARVVLVTHSEREPQSQLVGRKEVRRGRPQRVTLELDDQPGFEQILVHVAMMPHKGARETPNESMSVPQAPAPALMERQRKQLVDQYGPGWIREFLAHHIAASP